MKGVHTIVDSVNLFLYRTEAFNNGLLTQYQKWMLEWISEWIFSHDFLELQYL